jgi:hypothetical protein
LRAGAAAGVGAGAKGVAAATFLVVEAPGFFGAAAFSAVVTLGDFPGTERAAVDLAATAPLALAAVFGVPGLLPVAVAALRAAAGVSGSDGVLGVMACGSGLPKARAFTVG